MNFSDAGYMFTNHIYGLSEENRMNRIRRMQAMLEEEKIDFAVFIGKGFNGFGTWFTGLPNQEYPEVNSGAYILPAQGDLIDVGSNTLITEEYLKTFRELDVIQPPHAEVAHLVGMGGFSETMLQALPGTNKRIGFVNMEHLRANVADYIAKALPGYEWVDLTEKALKVQAIKSEEELKAVALSAKCHDRAFSALSLGLQEGKTEREAVVGLRRSLLDFGAAGQEVAHIMPVWVTSSAQNAVSENQPIAYPGRRFKEGDRINVSTMSALYSDYRAGLGRCYVLGEATEETKKFWNAAVAVQQTVAQAANNGVTLGKLQRIAKETFTDLGIEAQMKCNIYEIGYEAVRLSDVNCPLCANMTIVIAVEIIPENKDAYCCMDTFSVIEDGVVRLTETINDIIELKNF